jgi:nucleotidyltransferase/DNA polymerase involved in DNA repair
VPVDYAKYRRCSERIQTIFAQYDPNYSMAGLDEAYLDITECLRRSSPAVDRQQVVAEMRGRIFEQFGLTASAGIACNSLLAKVT